MPQLLRWIESSPHTKMPRACGDEALLAGRNPAQMGWYAFASDLARGQTVVDVGCGSGEGLRVLASHASRAVGIDLDARLQRPDLNVEIRSVTELPDKSFDVVVCLDVIEHVEDDRAFVAQLCRVARKAVVVSTPNYAVTFNRHPFHIREYTPYAFARLFRKYGRLTLYGGSAHGHERAEITRRAPYFLVAGLYRWKPTLVLAKVLKRVLRVRMWKHNAAVVRL